MMRNSQSTRLDAYQLLHNGTLALARAERQGVRIDVDLCREQINAIKEKTTKLTEKFSDSKMGRAWRDKFGSKSNFESPQQLSTMLYSVYALKPPKLTSNENGSTDEDALRSLNIPELNDLISIRKYRKISGTYLTSYVREQVDGVMHPFFSLNTVVTYRSSSDSPNLQNVPIRDEEAMEICRSVMFARRGHLLMEIDFSGVEVSGAACYHQDPEMLRYLHDPKSDMHGDQAYLLYKLKPFDKVIREHGFKGNPDLYRLRQGGKNSFVFPEFYGDYYGNCAVGLACVWGKLPQGQWQSGQGVMLPGGIYLSDHLIGQGLSSLDKFTENVKKVEDVFWNKRFKVYNAWRKKWFSDYQKNGHFDMLTGFRCSGVMGKNDVSNYPVQGVAFHWLLWTFIETDKVMQQEKWRTRLIGEVHDSMMLDVHPDEVKHVVETCQRIACVELPRKFPWINVPINIEIKLTDIDKPWSQVHAYKD
jgi:DNA polymerase family A